jgi:hypothetical protein
LTQGIAAGNSQDDPTSLLLIRYSDDIAKDGGGENAARYALIASQHADPALSLAAINAKKFVNSLRVHIF